MKKTALEVVNAFQQSLGSGNCEWENMISENISFIGPVDQVQGKQAFIELNKGFFPKVRGYEPKTAFDSGEYVCLEGIFKVATPNENVISLNMAEVYVVNEGKIQNVRVYYDAEEFRKEMAN